MHHLIHSTFLSSCAYYDAAILEIKSRRSMCLSAQTLYIHIRASRAKGSANYRCGGPSPPIVRRCRSINDSNKAHTHTHKHTPSGCTALRWPGTANDPPARTGSDAVNRHTFEGYFRARGGLGDIASICPLWPTERTPRTRINFRKMNPGGYVLHTYFYS
jgi:hypothetical protein